MICVNTHLLNKHLAELENAEMRDEAIQIKTDEIRDVLLSTNINVDAYVRDSNGYMCTLGDFMADMECDAGLFAEFLDGGDLLKDKIDEQLTKYCELLATDLIDNQEPEEQDY